MAPGRTRSHKHFRLDPVKIRRAQKVLRAGTETEAIDRALDLVISEHQRNRLAVEAHVALRDKRHCHKGRVQHLGEVVATGPLSKRRFT